MIQKVDWQALHREVFLHKIKVMKNLFLLFIVIGTNTIFCQVGIGTILPDVSSSLDINSANSGLLIPRVNLINVNDSTTPVNNPAVSLLVYNINTTLIGGNGVGYYYR